MKNFLPLIVFLSCENKDIAFTGSLEGKWVNLKTKTDTLIFDSSISEDFFLLSRGKEIQNGYLPPKPGTGIYQFKLLPEKNFYLQHTFKLLLFQRIFFRAAWFENNGRKFLRPCFKRNSTDIYKTQISSKGAKRKMMEFTLIKSTKIYNVPRLLG